MKSKYTVIEHNQNRNKITELGEFDNYEEALKRIEELFFWNSTILTYRSNTLIMLKLSWKMAKLLATKNFANWTKLIITNVYILATIVGITMADITQLLKSPNN